MSRIRLVALALAALATAPAHANPPVVAGGASATVSVRYVETVEPGTTWVRVLGGVLSAPSTKPAADVARAYLATRPEPLRGVSPAAFEIERVRAIPSGGALVKFRQMERGLDVIGGTVAVRVDAQGRVRWISSSAAPMAGHLVAQPAVDAAAALGAVLAGPARHYGQPALDPASHTRLVVYAVGRLTPRLAWMVALPRNVAMMETLRAYVDAQTGQVLYAENLVRTAKQANVFEWNPVTTPAESLATLDLPDMASMLEGPDMVVKNCIDNKNCTPFMTPFGTLDVHFCDIVPVATADGDGDFLHYTFPGHTTPEDEFSEVQMYYHTTKAYSFFRSLGFTSLAARPMTAVVNLRVPPLDASAICVGSTNDGPLNPIDNAAFMPQGSLGGSFPPGDWIVFGQGTKADFAYDGDVVYHEFTHAVMGTVTPELPFAIADAYGLDPTPGGMHEGYSDYFSSAMTGDPEVGEYAGNGLAPVPLPSGAIRSLANTKVCPDDLWGETHQDGEPWGGALWDIRTALVGGDRAAFDEAVFTVMDGLGGSDTQLTAAAATVAEVETTLGNAARDLAAAKFAARGLDDCNDRVIDATGAGYFKDLLFLTGTDQINGASIVPGPVQFKIRLAEDSTEIKVAIAASQAGGFGIPGQPQGMPGVKLVVKPGSAPITWNWATGTNDATATGDVTLSTMGQGGGAGAVAGAFPAGEYVVMLANAGATWVVAGISFSTTPGDITSDAGPTPDAAVGAPDAGPSVDDGGGDCGCRAGGRPSLPRDALALLALASLLLVRRRA